MTASPAPPGGLVLFDGVCAFCDGAVRWLIERDPHARLRFAPLQGETAAALRRRHPELPSDVDTLVYVETLGGAERVYLRSEAVWRACDAIGVLPRTMRTARRSEKQSLSANGRRCLPTAPIARLPNT